MSATPDRLVKRPARVTPTVIFSLLLAVSGGLAVWLLGTYAATGSWPEQTTSFTETVADTKISAPAIITIGAVAAALGLIFLIAGISPGDKRYREILDDEVPGQTAISRSDLASWVEAQTERLDGVQRASAHIKGKKLGLHVYTPIDNAEAVRSRTEKVVTKALEDIRPANRIKLRIHIVQTD